MALRYSLTYGPRQSIFNAYCGICSIFSTRFLNGLAPVIYEDGNQMRDFVFVEDVAAANVLVMEDDRANYKVFNVGTGKGTKVLEFAKLLRDAYEAEVDPLLPREFRPTDFRHLIADNSNIRALGWQPTVQVSEGDAGTQVVRAGVAARRRERIGQFEGIAAALQPQPGG